MNWSSISAIIKGNVDDSVIMSLSVVLATASHSHYTGADLRCVGFLCFFLSVSRSCIKVSSWCLASRARHVDIRSHLMRKSPLKISKHGQTMLHFDSYLHHPINEHEALFSQLAQMVAEFWHSNANLAYALHGKLTASLSAGWGEYDSQGWEAERWQWLEPKLARISFPPTHQGTTWHC